MRAFFIFLYNFNMKQNDRGSITPFFIIVITLVVIVGLIIFEYTFYKFNHSKQKAYMFSEMDAVMSTYHRKLFNELGLLAVRKEGLQSPISDHEVLSGQIKKIMEQKHLVKTITKAEDIVTEFIKRKSNFNVKVFDISHLNLQLYRIINDEASEVETKDFLTNLATVSMYAKLENISIDDLREMIEKMEFEKLKKLKPIFVIRPSIRKNIEEIIKAYEKYDIIGVYRHFILADYSVEYMGYNFTNEDHHLASEYIATGIENNTINKYIISSEIYLIRILLDFAETLSNPQIRKKIEKMSFGEPKLFAIVAVGVSALEAFYDTNRIIHGGKIPIYKGSDGFMAFHLTDKYYKRGFTYPDYLKIILMLNSRGTTLDRMLFAIKERYNIDPREFFTEISMKKMIVFKAKIIPFELKKIIKGRLSYE